MSQAPTAPAPPPASRSSLISLEFKDADVVNLLRTLAVHAGRNIVIGEDVKGKMSISLRQVPWDLALETVLETRGLEKIEKDGVMRIVTREQLTKEREAIAKAREAQIKGEAEARAKLAEAQLKEAEAETKKMAAEAARREQDARGPLREETLRLPTPTPRRWPRPCRASSASRPRVRRSRALASSVVLSQARSPSRRSRSSSPRPGATRHRRQPWCPSLRMSWPRA